MQHPILPHNPDQCLHSTHPSLTMQQSAWSIRTQMHHHYKEKSHPTLLSNINASEQTDTHKLGLVSGVLQRSMGEATQNLHLTQSLRMSFIVLQHKKKLQTKPKPHKVARNKIILPSSLLLLTKLQHNPLTCLPSLPNLNFITITQAEPSSSRLPSIRPYHHAKQGNCHPTNMHVVLSAASNSTAMIAIFL